MSEKPRMIEITDSWTLRVLEAGQGELDCPKLIDGKYVDAVEWRAWPIRRSTQSETGEKHEG